MSARDTDGPVHEWFSLSYSNYLVLHRTLMQSMPAEWQERMVACLRELGNAFEHVPQAEAYEVTAAAERIVGEMTPDELIRAGITEDESDEPTYSRGGYELDSGERVLLPAADPVPHYNRGRTYIQPRLKGG